MKKLDLSQYKIKKSTITNERQLIMKEFLDILNADRKDYPPLRPSRLGVMFRHTTTSQMKQFMGECKYAKNFSKFFWWSFKK
jgi:hypothetical protein